MDATIAFLETMGKDASLRHAGAEELRAATAGMGGDARFQEAVCRRDRGALATYLQVRSHAMCALFPVKEDDDKDDKKEPDHDDEQEITLNHAEHAPS